MKWVKLVGLSIHIGSQLTCLKATKKAVKQLCLLARSLKENWEFMDLGGGLGVNYSDEQLVPSAAEYMNSIQKILKKELYPYLSNNLFKVVFEPGRFLTARSGVLVTQVIRIKESGSLKFSIVDGAMNDFARPSLYSAYHQIVPVMKRKGEATPFDIVGPVCESTDYFARQRMMSPMKADDYLIISDAGAYGSSMSSSYNLREITKEYLLDKNGKIKKLKRH